MDDHFLEGIGKEIEALLLAYVGCAGISNTSSENSATDFVMRTVAAMPYFQRHSTHCGAYAIPGDAFGRSVCWALVKGRGEKTVVLLHHSDVVDVEDYGRLRAFAFSPYQLEDELRNVPLSADARADLMSGDWLFGHGACDMKAGGAIQLALLRRYSELSVFQGNLLLLCVPDEENLSAGMRAAITLLGELKTRFTLDFALLLNSEPEPEGVFSLGSVGKLMPMIYVRGVLAHINNPDGGLNPLLPLARILQKTERNPAFTYPPAWLCLRDGKTHYDVSIPQSAYGCLNILTQCEQPDTVLQQLKLICAEAFAEVIPAGWHARVSCFGELLGEARQNPAFSDGYRAKLKSLAEQIAASKLSMVDGTLAAIEFVYQYIDDPSPRAVIALAPPFYPGVTNPGLALAQRLPAFVREKFSAAYTPQDYFTGVSDLSYASGGLSGCTALAENMPLLGRAYPLPGGIPMPCANIGPWGKDFHKLTERVYKEDLFVRTPAILREAVNHTLAGL